MTRGWTIGGAIAALLSIAGMWWLAVPRHEICVAIYPAPAGCGDHRVLPAAIWTVVLLAVVALGGLAVQRLQRAWLGPTVLVIVAGISVWAYWAVRYA